jgi:hypothetical protein
MVTLCRPWYAHSPELCVPLKLYSTLQEDFTPVGADDQDDEGMIVSVMISYLKMLLKSLRSIEHQV